MHHDAVLTLKQRHCNVTECYIDVETTLKRWNDFWGTLLSTGLQDKKYTIWGALLQRVSDNNLNREFIPLKVLSLFKFVNIQTPNKSLILNWVLLMWKWHKRNKLQNEKKQHTTKVKALWEGKKCSLHVLDCLSRL